MATLLPNGEQQFVDANGVPYAGGFVYFYTPNTSSPKNTWQDATQLILNTNPVILDAAGRAIIYGSGQYRQILQDPLGNTVWDQLTQDLSTVVSIWAGTATGTGDAIILTPSPVITALVVGQIYSGIANSTNTTASTLQVSSLPAHPIKVNSALGLTDTSAGQISAGGSYMWQWDGTEFILLNPTNAAAVLTGSVLLWTTSTAPAGYLECNGTAVNRTTYATLFTVIGITYGPGDSVTTFNLPDMRGLFARGWDNGASRDPARVFGSTQQDQFQTHGHSVTDPGHHHPPLSGTFVQDAGGGGQLTNGGPNTAALAANTGNASTGLTVGNPNSGTSGTETRPKNIALMYCIKT